MPETTLQNGCRPVALFSWQENAEDVNAILSLKKRFVNAKKRLEQLRKVN
jgi:hypothetical protein